MTKIQIRRDTSTNWQQYNPTPSSGEPCYETDTGKLKIGNGTTPYNDLEYIGDGGGGETYTLPPATTDTLGGIKVGTNLSITADGTLSATSATPSNMMTTNTSQTISGDKTFTAHDIILYATEASTLSKIRGRYSNGTRDIINPTGSTYSGPCFGSTYRTTRLASSPNIGIEVVADGDTPTATTATGRLIHTGNMLGCITAGDNISITETGTGRNRQMVISSTGGSSEPPANMVTTDTAQTITGSKTFNEPVTIEGSTISGEADLTIQKSSASAAVIKFGERGATIKGDSSDICYLGDTYIQTVVPIQAAYALDADKPYYLNQNSITAGSDNLVISKTDTGIQITCNTPTGALKYWTGIETDYTAISTKDPDTLYRTTDTNKVFLGTIQLGGQNI